MGAISSLVASTPFREPQTPPCASTSGGTPGPACAPHQSGSTEVVDAYNSAMDKIASLVSQPVMRNHLNAQLSAPLKNVSKEERLRTVEKAREDCQLLCNIITPNDGEELFHSMTTSSENQNDVFIPDDLVLLTTAYKNAGTRNLKRQILSLYAYRYSVKTLQKIHELYECLSS